MAGQFLAQGAGDLRRLRASVDLDRVVIDAPGFKYQRLLPLALRYALWATAPGGHIVVRDTGVDDPHGAPFEVPFNLVRRWVFQFLGRDVDVLPAAAKGEIELVRRTPILPRGWSAGVVFSGREQEWPDLKTCLAGLAAQPELSPAEGGEILVCGPPGAEPPFLRDYPGARYLDYTPPPGDRFLIGHKKTALAAAMNGPRIAILHARVILEPGALAGLPREFDITGPNTVFKGPSGAIPYLSLAAVDEPAPGRMPRRLITNLRNIPGYDPIQLHRLGGVFVDGGAFFTTKALYERCGLDDHIGWGEGEDVEWCARALHCGYISDLAEDCHAYSTNSKLPERPALGALHRPVQAVVRELKLARAALRHAVRPRKP